MLGLGEKICRYDFRLCLSIRNYQHFTGSCYKIDSDLSITLTFRLRYIAVSRAYNQIDRTNLFRPIRKSGEQAVIRFTPATFAGIPSISAVE